MSILKKIKDCKLKRNRFLGFLIIYLVSLGIGLYAHAVLFFEGYKVVGFVGTVIVLFVMFVWDTLYRETGL